LKQETRNFIFLAKQGHNKWKWIAITSLIVLIPLVLNFIASFYIDFEQLIAEAIEQQSKNKFLFDSLMPMAVFLLAIFGMVRFAHKRSILSLTTARTKVDWGRVFFSFGLWSALTGGLILIEIFWISPEDFTYNFQLQPFLWLCLIAFTLIPIQIAFEEYFFRGYLLQELGSKLNNKWIALLISSLLFGLLHIANPEVSAFGSYILFYYILSGFFLGTIVLKDNGLELVLGFHAANNITIALLTTSKSAALQTDALFVDHSETVVDFFIFLPILVLYPLVLWVFSRKYKWFKVQGSRFMV